MPHRALSSNHAFTLIELLIVILVIGILIAVAAPSFLGQTEKAEDSASKQSLSIAYRTAKAYAVDGNGAPGHVQGTFDGFNAAGVLEAMEPGMVSHPNANCPEDAVGFDHEHIFIETALGDDLTICADPNGKVWTLEVIDGVLQPFGAPYEAGGEPPAEPGAPVKLTDNAVGDEIRLPSLNGGQLLLAASGVNYPGFNLYSLPTGGGTPQLLTVDDPEHYYVNGEASGTTYVFVASGANIGSGADHLYKQTGSPFSVATATPLTDDTSEPNGISSFSLFDGGSKAAYFSQLDSTIKKIDLAGNVLAVSPVSTSGQSFSISDDGSKLAYVSPSGDAIVSNFDGTGQVVILPAASGTNVQVEFSPDASKVVVVAQRSCVPNSCYELLVHNADGSGSEQVLLHYAVEAGGIQSPVWGPDGNIYFIGTGLDLYAVPTS